MGRLDDKTAFITGAAGSIGAATARRFAEEGARVVLSDLDAERLHALAGELGAEAAVADVTDAAAVAAAVEQAGELDIAFANAGVFGDVAPVAECDEAVFAHVLAVNVLGPFHVAKHALRAMRPGGSLILNSSVVGLTSDPGICAYATSKHALVGLMRTAARRSPSAASGSTRSIPARWTTPSSTGSRRWRRARARPARRRSSSA